MFSGLYMNGEQNRLVESNLSGDTPSPDASRNILVNLTLSVFKRAKLDHFCPLPIKSNKPQSHMNNMAHNKMVMLYTLLHVCVNI